MELSGRNDVEQLEAKKDIKALIAALTHEKEEIRRAAVRALGRLGDPQAVEALIGIMAEGGYIGSAAVDALGLIGDSRVIEPLIDMYKQRKPVALIKGTELFIKLGDRRGIEPLMANLQDPDPHIRLFAAWALVNIGDAGIREQIFASYKAKEDITDAAASGTPILVQLLLMAGVDVDIKTSGGYTPLLIAAGRGRTDVVKILLEAGANVNARGESGRTAYDLAMDRDYGETGAVIREYASTQGIDVID